MNKEPKENELNPCPFCGSPPDTAMSGDLFVITCGKGDCWMDSQFAGYSKEGIIQRWNTRQTESRLAEQNRILLEGLEHYADKLNWGRSDVSKWKDWYSPVNDETNRYKQANGYDHAQQKLAEAEEVGDD